MQKTITYLCFIICLMILTPAYATDFNKKSIEIFIEKSDQAIQTRNADAIAAMLSDNIKITMNLTNKGQQESMIFSKEEYMSMLREAWNECDSYHYKRTELNIEIKENKAVVSIRSTENMSLNGQKFFSESAEESIVQRINNQLMVTEIISYTNM